MPRNKHKSAEQKTLENLEKLLKDVKTVIVGISGGPDSVFLLNCLLKFKQNHPLKIIVAHVNHLLRGKQSDLDESFVKKLAEKNGLKFEKIKADIKSLAKKSGLSLEATGRKIRYEFFLKLQKKYKANTVLTAHHSDDNLETVLLNFLRGAGLKGLSGMEDKSTHSNGLKLTRPLLCVTKKEISDHLKKSKIQFRKDLSNFDTKIPRNFLRSKIIPQLKKLNPNLSQTILKNSQNLKEIQDFLEQIAKRSYEPLSLSPLPKAFNLKLIQSQPIAIQKEILRLIYFKKAGTTKDISSKHIDEVVEIINKNIGGKRKKLGKYTIEIKSKLLHYL
jgi:tRNA(Ile)-lysidine synthase